MRWLELLIGLEVVGIGRLALRSRVRSLRLVLRHLEAVLRLKLRHWWLVSLRLPKTILSLGSLETVAKARHLRGRSLSHRLR